jgi:hypothetical protein
VLGLRERFMDYPLLIATAIAFLARVATFAFLVLLWRRTRITGFAVLAGLTVFAEISTRASSLYARAHPHLSLEQLFYFPLVMQATGAVAAVVSVFAWWRIYARSKPTEA